MKVLVYKQRGSIIMAGRTKGDFDSDAQVRMTKMFEPIKYYIDGIYLVDIDNSHIDIIIDKVELDNVIDSNEWDYILNINPNKKGKTDRDRKK